MDYGNYVIGNTFPEHIKVTIGLFVVEITLQNYIKPFIIYFHKSLIARFKTVLRISRILNLSRECIPSHNWILN